MAASSVTTAHAPLVVLRWTALALAAVTLILSGVLAALTVPAAHAGDAGDARAPLGAFTGILGLLTATSLAGSGLALARHRDGARTLAAVGLLAATAWGVTRVTLSPDADAWRVLARVGLLVALPAALLLLANGTERALTRRLLGAGALVAVATTLLGHAWRATPDAWNPLARALLVSLPDVGYAVAVVPYATAVLLVLHAERTRDATAA